MYRVGSPGFRARRQTIVPLESQPPDELRDIYKQIDDEDSLTDLEGPEDEAIPAQDGLGNRVRRLSTGSGLGESGDEHRDVFGGHDANLLDDTTDPSPRRKLVDHAADEQRLRRATTSHSPAFSRARVGKDGLTSEDLQRRDEDVQHLSEDDGNAGPSLNLPSSWGSRSAKSRDWMRNIRSGEEPREDKEKPADPFSSNGIMDSSVRPASATERSPRSSSYLKRNAQGERIFNSRPRPASPDESRKLSPTRKNQQYSEDDVPNTPTVGYKTSSFNKVTPTKRDSHQLLRKLSRNPSPNQDQSEARTPEAPKQPESHIYDKTPVVTGAWIDTPVTERPAQFPDHVSNGLNSTTEPEKPRQENPSHREEAQVDKAPQPKSQPARETRRAPLIKPNLPKSGLETVMEDVRADKDSYAVGDDTIESLQQLLEAPPTEPKTEEEENAESEKAILKKLEVAEPDDKGPVDLEKYDDKLHSIAQALRDIRKGLNNLEDYVSLDPELSMRQPSPIDGKKARHIHAGESCKTCGAHSDGRMYASIPVPRLWKHNPISQRTHLTRLGWCTLIFIFWFFSESTMCDYYCHPTITNVCTGNCLMRNAPRFPFVIPTMLWRWTNMSIILGPFIALLTGFFKLFALMLGLSDGFVDDVPRNLNLTGEIRIRGTRVSDFPVATASSSRDFMPRSFWHGRNRPHSHAPPPPGARDVPVPELDLNLDDDGSMDADEYLS